MMTEGIITRPAVAGQKVSRDKNGENRLESSSPGVFTRICYLQDARTELELEIQSMSETLKSFLTPELPCDPPTKSMDVECNSDISSQIQAEVYAIRRLVTVINILKQRLDV